MHLDNENQNSRGKSLTPCCPPLWPAPLRRLPEDALSAAWTRSGVLDSKASGSTLWGKADRGLQDLLPPQTKSWPLFDPKRPAWETRARKKGGEGEANGKAIPGQTRRRGMLRGLQGCATPADLQVNAKKPWKSELFLKKKTGLYSRTEAAAPRPGL